MTTTFPIRCSYPLDHSLRQKVIIQDLGDGHEQRVGKSQAYSHADGLGGVTSYKGRNYFSINIKNMRHVNASSTELANLLWAFYQSVGTLTPFYFYNPYENTGDPTLTPLSDGSATTGRYLVRFMDENLSRSLFRRFLFNASLTLIEVRA